MKTRKENTNNNDFFKFAKIGSKVQGTYHGLYTSKYGLVMKLDNYYVPLNNKALKNVLKDNIKTFIKDKTAVIITYVSDKKIKGQKNPAKIFEIILDGKPIQSNFSLNEATKNEIEMFFFD